MWSSNESWRKERGAAVVLLACGCHLQQGPRETATRPLSSLFRREITDATFPFSRTFVFFMRSVPFPAVLLFFALKDPQQAPNQRGRLEKGSGRAEEDERKPSTSLREVENSLLSRSFGTSQAFPKMHGNGPNGSR